MFRSALVFNTKASSFSWLISVLQTEIVRVVQISLLEVKELVFLFWKAVESGVLLLSKDLSVSFHLKQNCYPESKSKPLHGYHLLFLWGFCFWLMWVCCVSQIASQPPQNSFHCLQQGRTFLNSLRSGTQRQTLSLALEKSQVKPKRGRRSEVLF